MEIDIDKYLSDDTKKKIAEDVFRAELEKSAKEAERFLNTTNTSIIYGKIISEYVDKLKGTTDRSQYFEKILQREVNEILEKDANVDYESYRNRFAYEIRQKVHQMIFEYIDLNKERLFAELDKNLLRLCEEVLPLEIITNTIGRMSIDERDKNEIIRLLSKKYLLTKKSEVDTVEKIIC